MKYCGDVIDRSYFSVKGDTYYGVWELSRNDNNNQTRRIYSDEVPMADLREFRRSRIPIGVLINQDLVENGDLT